MRKKSTLRLLAKPPLASQGTDAERLQAVTQALLAFGAHDVVSRIDDLRFRAAVHELPDFFYIKDRSSRFLYANSATARSVGVDDPTTLVGKTDFELWRHEKAVEFMRIEQEIIATGEPRLDVEDWIPPVGDGEMTCRLTSKMPLRNDRNEIIGLIGISRDITERKRQEQLRRRQAEILEMIAKNEPLEAILEALVLLVEEELSGISGSILLLDPDGLHLFRGAAPNLPAAYNKLIDGVAIGPKVGSCGTAAWRGERVIVSDIRTDPLWEDFRGVVSQFNLRSCWSTPIVTAQRNVLGTIALYSPQVREPTESELEMVAVATHIAGIAIERKRAEDRIYFMAHHDDLTGLPNRAFLKDQMARILFQARRHNRRVTVAYIDLDNFKDINDGRGHAAGDDVLKEISARMVNCVRASDIVVRLGGDEFLVVLVHQASHDAGIIRRLRELKRVIARPLKIQGCDIVVTSSIGVASFPDDGHTQEELLANADAAMYRAKNLGRNTMQHYTRQQDTRKSVPLSEEEELRYAIAANQLFVDYQPQIELASGRIVGTEALVRWRHPTLGLLPPSQFIPLAEDTGMIIPLGLFVLNEACRQNKSWQDLGLPPMIVAVNVSAKQFGDPALAEHVVEALQASGLEPQWLELELTESTLMDDAPRALSVMQALKALGVRLSIDDFGTGYSSLSALKTFPFNRLKMDRSLVDALPRDDTTVAIASAVISLARKLKLSVVAEGVETDEQLEFLRESLCDEAQGYLISRPVAPDAIERLLQERKMLASRA
ncbi:EAL domain-containing protein [Rhizobium tubonense]|uniref:Histidine kinase n=1 Tax=Rhizobium tubonense TaxID=484088 RepID=A0A2W4D1C2_9HYPH|nr:EAL domain-containing protein [Rhizobium tubonense]PZM17221.1 histidine kinase [Rhizobium tubonense]